MSTPSQAAWSLMIRKGAEVIQSVPVGSDLIVGRGERCSVRLDDRAISRQHLILRVSSGQIIAEKKSEFAPLLINGVPQSLLTLQHGDQIQLGAYLLVIEKNATESPSKAQSKGAQPGQDAEHSQDHAAPLAAESSSGELGGDAGLGEVSQQDEASDAAQEIPGDGQQGLESLSGEAGSVEDGAFGQEGQAEGSVAGDSQFQINGEGMSGEGSPDEQAQLSSGSDSPEGESSGTGAGIVDEDAKTKAISLEKVVAKLILRSGAANFTELVIEKNELLIGRGQDCDIIIDDKKASRKNSLIRRAGLHFSIKDLDSSNGTYVNGEKITETELNSDDLIQIGNVEIEFKVTSLDYESKQGEFIAVPEEALQESAPLADQMMGSVTAGSGVAAGLDPQLGAGGGVSGDLGLGGADSQPISGITGIGGESPGKKKTLIERFKALPKRTQIIGMIAGGLFFLWLMSEDEEPKKIQKKVDQKKSDKPVASASKSPTPDASGSSASGAASDLVFDQLPPEKKKYVESQHDLAFDYYKNKEYDKALFEIEKVFSIVSDYKDSREIERYAREGKRKLEAIEEENRKRAEAQALKAKIADNLAQIKELMDKKNYTKAKELYAEVLAVDPDNAQIATWSKEIEQYEEDQRVLQQRLEAQRDINEQGWKFYREANALSKKKKYHDAVEVLKKIKEMGVTDQKLVSRAQSEIIRCKNEIKSLREPILKEAQDAENSGDYETSFKLYQKSTVIDPPHPEGYAGMNRIRGFLHEKAKAAYIEGIFAESYSDFASAEKFYRECLKVAPPEDIYHDRAKRKLSRFFRKSDEPVDKASGANQGSDQDGS